MVRKLFLIFLILLNFSVTSAIAATRTVNLSGTGTVVSANTPEDEFAGPYASWINVQTGAPVGGGGAVCTGTGTSLTGNVDAALQSCITYEQHNGGALYFPAGTYLLGSTLTWTACNSTNSGCAGYSAIYYPPRMYGHSPTDTILKWNSGSVSPMFSSPAGYDVSLLDIHRLTWNLNATASVGMQFLESGSVSVGGWQGAITDVTFERCAPTSLNPPSFPCAQGGVGLNLQPPDTQIIRGRFYNFTCAIYEGDNGAGDPCGPITSGGNNQNNSSMFDTFINNNISIYANAFGGWYSVGSVFIHSNTYDIDTQSGNYISFSMVNNVSSGSGRFYQNNDGRDTGVTLRGNRILNPTSGNAVNMAGETGYLALDNQIVSSGTPFTGNANQGSAMAIGNQFSVGSGGFNLGSNPRLKEINDTYGVTGISTACPTISGSTSTDLSSCYPTPPNTGIDSGSGNPHRLCYFNGGSSAQCGSAGSDEAGSNIQGDVNAACPSGYQGGNHPQIHLTSGTHTLNATLVIPGHCDVHIVGEGAYFSGPTYLTTNSTITPMIQIQSPGKASLEYMNLGGTSESVIVQVDSEDSAATGPGNVGAARVTAWQHLAIVNGNLAFNVETTGLTNTIVDWNGGSSAGDYWRTCPCLTSSYTANGDGNFASPSALRVWEYNDNIGPVASVTNQGHVVAEHNWDELNLAGGNNPILYADTGNSGSVIVSDIGMANPNSNPFITINGGANVTYTLTHLGQSFGPGSGTVNISGPSKVLVNDNGFASTFSGTINYGSSGSGISTYMNWWGQPGANNVMSNDNPNGLFDGTHDAQILAQYALFRPGGIEQSSTPDFVLPAGVTDVHLIHNAVTCNSSGGTFLTVCKAGASGCGP